MVSEIQIKSSISVRFKIQWQIWVEDRDFDLNSIIFWLKLITLDLLLIKINHYWSIFDKKIKKDRQNVNYLIENDELYQNNYEI